MPGLWNVSSLTALLGHFLFVEEIWHDCVSRGANSTDRNYAGVPTGSSAKEALLHLQVRTWSSLPPDLRPPLRPAPSSDLPARERQLGQQ